MREVSVTIDIEYKHRSGTHTCSEPWKPTDYFCPCCGKQSVWNQCDGGDCYQGEQFLCIGCGVHWNWPSEPTEPHERYPDQTQRIEKLRDVARNFPVT